MALDVLDELNKVMWNLHRESLEPLANLSETSDKIIIEIDLPLVEKKNITLKLVEAGLEVEAALTRCVTFHRWGTIQKSCEFRSLHKIVHLPSSVVPDGAKATFRKGILTVELKRRKETEVRIPIQ